MRILSYIVFFMIVATAFGFSLLNFQVVNINLYLMELNIPLAVALSLELVIGVVIGFTLCFLQMRAFKIDNKVLQKQLSDLEKASK